MTRKLFVKKLLVSFMGSALAILVYDGVESFFRLLRLEGSFSQARALERSLSETIGDSLQLGRSKMKVL